MDANDHHDRDGHDSHLESSGGEDDMTIHSTKTPPAASTARSHNASASAEPDDIHGGGAQLALHRTLSRVQSLTQNFGQRPACFRSTVQEVSFVAQATIAMSTATFLVGASSIVTAVIGADLGMTQAQIVWISAAPTLAAGAFQLAVGQLSDLLGRKLTYLAGMGSFTVFVLLLGFAQNPFWMDVVLGVLGISCAMVVPPAGGVLGAAYGRPSMRKNLAFAAFSAGNPTGFVLGSITCGIATRLFNVSLFSSLAGVVLFWCILETLADIWSITVEGFVLVHRHTVRCLLLARALGGPQSRGL